MHHAIMREHSIDAIKCGQQEGRHCIPYIICPVISEVNVVTVITEHSLVSKDFLSRPRSEADPDTR